MERTVELIGLDYHEIACVREDIVSAIVLGNAPEESVAVYMALVHDMRAYCRGGRFAVRAGHTQPLMGTGQCAQDLCTFLNLETFGLEILQFGMCCGYGGGVDDKAGLLVAACVGNLVDILFVVNDHPFLFQLLGQFGGSLVISRND